VHQSDREKAAASARATGGSEAGSVVLRGAVRFPAGVLEAFLISIAATSFGPAETVLVGVVRVCDGPT
jgi:hypothetical protein